MRSLVRKLSPACYWMGKSLGSQVFWLYFWLVLSFHVLSSIGDSECGGVSACKNGKCIDNVCICDPGWTGQYCQFCHGKIKVDGSRGWLSDGPGNYTSNMKCSWLIESVSPKGNTTAPSPIILHFEEFATECGWDHLYIYDGDNVHAPLLGIFSGLLVQSHYKAIGLPEIVAKSGFALLHFYTDVAYNLTGFNITYRTRSCPSDDSSVACSGNGACLDSECTCNAKYTGDACNIEKCPNNCSGQGKCDMEIHKCRCDEGFKGHDCSQISSQGYWEVISPQSSIPRGSGSHGSVVYNHSLWIVGGNRLELESKDSILRRYDLRGNTWEDIVPEFGANPPALYGHTSVIYGSKIYMYGGVRDGKFGNRYVTNKLWTFDIAKRSWSEVVGKTKCTRGLCAPLNVAGHSSVVVEGDNDKIREVKMVVISGHSPRFGYVNLVQEYFFESRTWSVAPTKGFPFSGRYGHSSTWDPLTQQIYVFGGYSIGYGSDPTPTTVNSMFSYDPFKYTWKLLQSAPSHRFLHAGVDYRGLVLIFGGNSHNDTAYSLGSKCFADDVIVYDVICGSWSLLRPASIPADVSRYGLSGSVYQGSIYLYGGFNGMLQQDLIRFTPPLCRELNSSNSCLNSASLGVKCYWNRSKKSCEEANLRLPWGIEEKYIQKCQKRSVAVDEESTHNCTAYRSCASCVQNYEDCAWCGKTCTNSTCKDPRHEALKSFEQCKSEETDCGSVLHNCPLCASQPNCMWTKKKRCVKDSVSTRNVTDFVEEKEGIPCDLSCEVHSTCYNCTSNNCMWCDNLSSCVDKNSYVISFPYGQCMSWTLNRNLCLSKDPHTIATSICTEVDTCEKCLSLPACGWCDDGSGIGLGKCMDGSHRGPLTVNSTGIHLNYSMCSVDLWHFTDCPACQCNGHSFCDDANQCVDCDGFTEGKNCETCMKGYYGKALNGGLCKPCVCNSQAEICHQKTGRCFCTTKGVTGEDCSRCDTQNNYVGDPLNGSCFYELQIDYQFTFNLSKPEDQHYTRINFRNTPTKPDLDVDFHIHCSIPAKLNISYSKRGLPEEILIEELNCTPPYKFQFAKADYNFGIPDNTTFYVYVYEFHPPLWIKISFSQSPKLDLLHFFITFSTCFLLLLLVSAVLWKIKQRYDVYRRRQRLFVEMEQMASRPFAQVYVEVGKSIVASSARSVRKRRKESPSPIALEPCCGNRAAVLSLLVKMPSGSHSFTPSGQSGITIGSVLVALGNPRKASYEPVSKTESKSSGQPE